MPIKQQKELKYIPLEDTENYFYSFDLGLCAALVSLGFPLASLDKANPNKVRFIFRKKVGIDKSIADYWAGGLEIRARTYFENIKMLKNRIFSY